MIAARLSGGVQAATTTLEPSPRTVGRGGLPGPWSQYRRSPRSLRVRSSRARSASGTHPLSRVCRTFSTRNALRLPSALGNFPLTSLFDRSSAVSDDNALSPAGTVPVSALPASRSSVTRPGAPPVVTPSHEETAASALQFSEPVPASSAFAASSARQSATSPALFPGSATATPLAQSSCAVTVSRFDASLSLPASSCATPAATATVTVPDPLGVTVAAYSVPRPLSVAVPPATVRSPASNPVTGSLNVTVTSNAPFTVPAGPLSSTVSGSSSLSATTALTVAPALTPAGSAPNPNATDSSALSASWFAVTVNDALLRPTANVTAPPVSPLTV